MPRDPSRSNSRAGCAAHALAVSRWAVSGLAVSALAISALMLLVGCVSARAPSDSELAGQWQLDPAASDNVQARIAQAVDKAEARQRRRRPNDADQTFSGRGRGGRGGAGNGGSSDDNTQAASELPLTTPVLGPDFPQLRAHLLQVLGAPPSLSLSVAQDSVTIKSDGLPPRDYEPGESFVRFDEYGNATVSCGWSGQAFVVREKYMSRAALTERYEVDPKSGTLTYTRELSDPAVGSIELKSVYHHA